MKSSTDEDGRGLVAEFETPAALVGAALALQQLGFRRYDALTPCPLPELDRAMALPTSPLPRIVLASAVITGLLGYALQWYSVMLDYPLNVGGRPYHSWPSFIPITFELTILGGATGAVLGMILLCGLPQPYHRAFDAPRIERATQDLFFLHVEAADPCYHEQDTRQLLLELGSTGVSDV